MPTQTLALVGVAGGAGTTRLAIECGGTLARAGLEVAILDAAFATQGLGEYVPGPVDADVTDLVTGTADLDATLYDLSIDAPGTLSLCPARAPFEPLARAKTAGAAERFEKHLAAAALSHDVVIVDTPPVAANQAVAAVDAAERVALVAPDTVRGADGLARMSGRIADVGAEVDATVANFAGEDPVVRDADAWVPTTDVTDPTDCPSCLSVDETFAPAVAAATEAVLDTSLGLEFEESGRFGNLF
jgi:septum site-determining protein MinD